MEGKAKVALTFAVSQGGQLLRRETIAQDIVKVGKDPRSHLRVDDDLASRMHAVIEVASPGDITLIDLGNEPGTMVNGQRVNKCKIQPGDQIQIGSTIIALESAVSADVVAATAATVEAPAQPAAPAAAAPTAGANPFGGSNPFAAAPANPFASASPFASTAAPVVAAATDVDPSAPPGSYTYQMIKSGPDVNPDEVEMTHIAAVEVEVIWDSNVLHAEVIASNKQFIIGEDTQARQDIAKAERLMEYGFMTGATLTLAGYMMKKSAKARLYNFFVPTEVLGTTVAPIVLLGGTVMILPNSTGWVDVPGQGRVTLADLISSHRARPSSNLSGAHEFALPPGGKLRQELATGLTFQVTAGNAGKAPPMGAFSSFDPAGYMYTGLSFLMHIGILASLFFFMPNLGADDSEALDRDMILKMQHLLNAEAEREQEQKDTEEVTDNNADQKEGGTGTRAKGEEGSMGNPNTNKTGMKFGVQGPQDNQDPHIARQAAIKEAAEFGMIGLLNAAAGADPNAPTAPWGREDSLGNDPMSARGNMWGDAIGDSFGAGGLGLSGVGEGGGGRGEGIGLGNIGTIGHGAGTGTGQGFGNGHGRLGGHHAPKPPSLRQGQTQVNGRLPPEVIQRIVRQNFGRFKLCYESGLRSNPALAGRVSIKFVIDRSGAVSTAQDGGSEIPDQTVVQCVVRGFTNLSFPQPEGGIVTVVYPIIFAPGEAGD